MICIDNTNKNPYFNLALEEYLLTNFAEDIFMLWINNPAIIVGKNQNTLAEINIEYVKEHNIPVVRRLSGGGAVFHDPGNINFTFIMPNSSDSFTNFKKYTQPIIDVLKKLGIEAKLSGRNDLTIAGRKFSGNSQYIYRDRILHHGTLLFSSNVSHLVNALKVNPDKIKSKGIKSVASRVTNISEHLKKDISIDYFKKTVMSHVMETYGGHKYILTSEDISNVNKMVKEKYATWEWNYGYSPKYDFTKQARFAGGTIEINLNVKYGIIQEAKIYGDFFGKRDVQDIENALIGTRHNERDIREVLSSYPLDEYFANISLDNLISICF